MAFKKAPEILEKFKIAAYKHQVVYEGLTKEQFDTKVKLALSKVSNLSKEFLMLTYLNNNHIWWCEYYSKSTYYFYLDKACKEFEQEFENIK